MIHSAGVIDCRSTDARVFSMYCSSSRTGEMSTYFHPICESQLRGVGASILRSGTNALGGLGTDRVWSAGIRTLRAQFWRLLALYSSITCRYTFRSFAPAAVQVAS